MVQAAFQILKSSRNTPYKIWIPSKIDFNVFFIYIFIGL